MRRSTPTVRRLLGAVALVLLFASCGSDPEVDASSGGAGDEGAAAQPDNGSGGEADEPSDPVPTTPPIEADDAEPPTVEPVEPDAQLPARPRATPPADAEDSGDPDRAAPPTPRPDAGAPGAAVTSPPRPPAPSEDPDTGWQRIEPMRNLLDPRPAQPEELLIASDGRTVLIRFWNGVPPCSGARASVTETATTVEVLLETGANPNAATMTCIALAGAYELAVPLDAPLAGRDLVATSAPAPPPGDPFEGAEFSTDQYLGLTLAEAEDLARVEQRPFRIGRIDDEQFALTMDFVANRVTVEVEAGIVVSAMGG